jgi:hypothetical protein
MVVADTLPDKRAARFAVARTLRALPVAECLVLSDECFVEGARHVLIDRLRGIPDYNGLMLDRLAAHLTCDAYLVVQWDGFALDGQRFEPAFLAHDYVGAPWLHHEGLVGAGGFSLRSRRLIVAIRDWRERTGLRDVETAEDIQTCIAHRRALAHAGYTFAPSEVAARFAFERIAHAPAQRDRPATFGFHGVFNFPLILAEREILLLFDAILPRMSARWSDWYLFIWHAWQRRYEALGIRLLSALAERNARDWAMVAQACLIRGVPRKWLEAA